MSIHWLKLAKPCILELPPDVKDYAGQRLVFRPRDGLRRGVREDVLNHPLVQRYLAARYLELENTVAKPVPAPRPVKAAKPVVESTPEPVLPICEVVAAEEMVIEVAEVDPEITDETDEVVETSEVSEVSDAEPETRKKRKKSRRYE